MGTWFWINVPLMVLAFALTIGLSYALLLRSRRPAKPAAGFAPAGFTPVGLTPAGLTPVGFTPAAVVAPAATAAAYTVRTRPAAA